MLRNYRSVFIILGMTLLSKMSFSQETCTHTVTSSNPSALISYLAGKYGEENTEQILINMHNYEIANNVTVLCEAAFKNTISRLSLIIANTPSLDERNLLQERKNSFVLLNTIEELIH